MLLIKGANIVDGTGKPPYRADVIIKNDRISAIGNFGSKKIDLTATVDALGSNLTPGFIDIHATSDHYLSLFTNPTQDDFLLQGVTSIIGGHCGASLAPLLYGSLESIRKWTDTNSVNVDWHSLREFWTALKKRPLGVNFGTLVGHSTIRRALIGEAMRDLTVGELDVMKRLIEESLDAGAFGVSTGLGYAHTHATPWNELKEIATLVAAHHALYATHLRDEKEGVTRAIEETAALARDTGANTLISHFRPRLGYESYYAEAYQTILADEEKYPLALETYPSDMALTPLYTLLPQWAKRGNLETMHRALFDPHLVERIEEELPEIDPEFLYVISAPDGEYLAGKSLATIAHDQGFSKQHTLIGLMKLTHLRGVIWYHNANLDWILQALASPRTFVGSNRPSIRKDLRTRLPEALVTMFPRFIEVMTMSKLKTLPEAIAQITSLPAKLLGLKNRGEIKEGNIADLVLLKNGRVSDVWVNGTRAVEHGVLLNGTGGKILLRN